MKSNDNVENRKVLSKTLEDINNVSKKFISSIDVWTDITLEKINQIVSDIETKTNEYNQLIIKKEKEYEELIIKKEKEYNELIVKKEKEYDDKEKIFSEKYISKKQELKHQHKIETEELKQQLKNIKIDTAQEIKEFKINACNEIAIKNDYKLVSLNEYEKHEHELKNIKDKLEEYEKSFNDKLIEKIETEKILLQEKQKQDLITKELNNKANNADLIAQNKHQLKEIEFLNKQIINLTNEVSEQRNLTKEIAKASSKAQINQSFNKD